MLRIEDSPRTAGGNLLPATAVLRSTVGMDIVSNSLVDRAAPVLGISASFRQETGNVQAIAVQIMVSNTEITLPCCLKTS